METILKLLEWFKVSPTIKVLAGLDKDKLTTYLGLVNALSTAALTYMLSPLAGDLSSVVFWFGMAKALQAAWSGWATNKAAKSAAVPVQG